MEKHAKLTPFVVLGVLMSMMIDLLADGSQKTVALFNSHSKRSSFYILWKKVECIISRLKATASNGRYRNPLSLALIKANIQALLKEAKTIG
jgi:hypothetical protein